MVSGLCETEDLRRIFNAIEDGQCLAFLGAGVSTSFTNHEGIEVPGLPCGWQLAKTLAEQCDYSNGKDKGKNNGKDNGKDKDFNLLEVAEYFQYYHDRGELLKVIQKKIKYCEPRPIHTVLAQLDQIKAIITTNYDVILENELLKYNRILNKHVYRVRKTDTGHFNPKPFPEKGDIYLHKMHGTVDEPESMVITKSDYIYYLANLNDIDRGMPEYFRRTLINNCRLLFLGYGLEDWNFQVIWEGVLAGYHRDFYPNEAFAIVKKPAPRHKEYWLKRNIKLIDCDLTLFAKELAKKFKKGIPQLGIQKPKGDNQ